NGTATFTVALNAAFAGNYAGNISFATNVSGSNPFTFQVTGDVIAPNSVIFVDDRDMGFSATAGFSQTISQAGTSGAVPLNGSLTATAAAGTGTESATWTVNVGILPGQYRVSATWVGYANAASNTQYTILDGTTPVGSVTVDQTADSAGFTDGGSVWQDLGTFTITGTSIAAQVTDTANGIVLADGIRFQRVGYPGAILDDASGVSFTGAWTPVAATTDFQSGRSTAAVTQTPGTPDATASWTFSVTPGTY